MRSSTSVITLTEVLKTMDNGAPFSITYVTADRKKRTGGQLMTHAQAQKIAHLADLPANILKANRISLANAKNPNHYTNSTRNIYIPRTREVRKLHIKLIVAFNGHTVLL